jgi:hypothetical protein
LQFTNQSPEQALEKAVERIRDTIGKPSAVSAVQLPAGSTSAGIQLSPPVIPTQSGIQSEIIKERDEAISDTHRPHPNLPLRGEGTSEFPLLLRVPIRGMGGDEGEVYSDNSPIQLASLTTDNLGSSFPPLKKGAGEFGFVPSPLAGESRSEGDVPDGVIHTKVGIHEVKTGFRVKHGMTENEFPLSTPSLSNSLTPIQVASIGSLNGILSSAIVQTIQPPTAADLTSTVEVQFTPAILAKAQELGYNAVNILHRTSLKFVAENSYKFNIGRMYGRDESKGHQGWTTMVYPGT